MDLLKWRKDWLKVWLGKSPSSAFESVTKHMSIIGVLFGDRSFSTKTFSLITRYVCDTWYTCAAILGTQVEPALGIKYKPQIPDENGMKKETNTNYDGQAVAYFIHWKGQWYN